MKIKVAAHTLLKGDVCTGTKETVIDVSSGLYAPRGKVEVILEKGEHRRTAIWGRYDLITVERK